MLTILINTPPYTGPILPKILEAAWRKLRVPCCVRDVFVAQVVLYGASVLPTVSGLPAENP